MLNDLKIGTRLGMGFCAILLMLCAVAGIGVYQTSHINDNVAELAQNWLPSVRILGELRDQANGVRRTTLRHILTPEKEEKAMQDVSHDTLRNQTIPATLAAYRKLANSPEEVRLYEQIKVSWDAYIEQDRILMALSSKGAAGFDDARSLSSGLSFDLFSTAMKAVGEGVAFSTANAAASSASASETYRKVLWINALSAGCALLAGTMLSLFITRSITRPVRQAVLLADAVAEGNLTTQVTVQGNDEAAHLLRALTRMNGNLISIVSQVRHSSESIATGSTQIASGNQNLSQRTEEQASNLEQTAASMEQISGTVKSNADTASIASGVAVRACAAAVKGGEVVGTAAETMQEIATSSKRIADILSVIDAIAFQTNILALNAAVEAARAGEQGRGFAVVAGEVRTLASRSAEAAKEIKALIGASVEKVTIGTLQVNEAQSTMQDIVTQIRHVTQLIGGISAATSEQSIGINQIGDAISQLDQVTQQNAALVEESAAAAESLREQALRLTEAVGVFKIGSAGIPHATFSSPAMPPVYASTPKPLVADKGMSAIKAKAKLSLAASTPRSHALPPAEEFKRTGTDNWEKF